MTSFIPEWEQCAKNVSEGTATALEVFIYNHEPVTWVDDFREQLQTAIEEAIENNKGVLRASNE